MITIIKVEIEIHFNLKELLLFWPEKWKLREIIVIKTYYPQSLNNLHVIVMWDADFPPFHFLMARTFTVDFARWFVLNNLFPVILLRKWHNILHRLQSAFKTYLGILKFLLVQQSSGSRFSIHLLGHLS